MKKVREFQRLLDAAQDLEMARLAALMANKQLLVSRIEGYRISKTQVQKDAVAVFNSSSMCAQRVNDKWGVWIDMQIQKKIDEMTQLAVTLEEQKKKSQIALGRVNAFKKLAEKKIESRKRAASQQ